MDGTRSALAARARRHGDGNIVGPGVDSSGDVDGGAIFGQPHERMFDARASNRLDQNVSGKTARKVKRVDDGASHDVASPRTRVLEGPSSHRESGRARQDHGGQ